ncbi:hypothetical protein MKX03_026676 [Papaver bracteatum]|nr:hypothetical protein MKX03_026676 [Papaver bracteatum]
MSSAALFFSSISSVSFSTITKIPPFSLAPTSILISNRTKIINIASQSQPRAVFLPSLARFY